jgi:hypothetical protein
VTAACGVENEIIAVHLLGRASTNIRSFNAEIAQLRQRAGVRQTSLIRAKALRSAPANTSDR